MGKRCFECDEEGHFARDCPKKGKGKGKSKGEGKGKGYNNYNNYGGGYFLGMIRRLGKGGVNSFSQGYATAYAQQPEVNPCLAFERGGSGLIADADLPIDQAISEFVIVERPEPDEIPWNLPVKYVKSLNKKKGADLNIPFPIEPRLGHLVPEVEDNVESHETLRLPPAADVEVICYNQEQTDSAGEFHSEPRAPVECTSKSSIVEQPLVRSVVRVSRFRRKIESRRSLRQLQRGCDEEFDRILNNEREIHGYIEERDLGG